MFNRHPRTLAILLTALLGLGGLGLQNAISADPRPYPEKEEKERHPHIRQSIRELREARKELRTADHDFGGHRVQAIEAVDGAIKQLEIALKYDRR
jgi:hypothetical protein